MTSHPKPFLSGRLHAAWGYLFLYLDVNLGTVSISPPSSVICLWSAISALEGGPGPVPPPVSCAPCWICGREPAGSIPGPAAA